MQISATGRGQQDARKSCFVFWTGTFQGMARKKSGAQLQREIDAALARPAKKRRLHHATVADEWSVAMDALIEHDPERAAQIIAEIRKGTKVPSYAVILDATPEFLNVLENSPDDVYDRFFDSLKTLQDTEAGVFFPPRKMDVIDKYGGFIAITSSGKRWIPSYIVKKGTIGSLVPGSIKYDDFYEDLLETHRPVVSALYKLPGYSYKVKGWWKSNGERIA